MTRRHKNLSPHEKNKYWLSMISRGLYHWSHTNSQKSYSSLLTYITSEHNLHVALNKVSTKKSKYTSGVDGFNATHIIDKKKYVRKIKYMLEKGTYTPSPVLRKWIKKSNQTDEFRPLGLLTFTDRVVQTAMLQIMEPLFEARFLPVSTGFRANKNSASAIKLITSLLDQNPEKDYWVIEGDIKKCFENICHYALLKRIEQTISDKKVISLIEDFLSSGVQDGNTFTATSCGLPQGAIISPLLCNIALSVIEENYHKSNFFPIRYCDDFILITSSSERDTQNEKERLQQVLLRRLGIELSEDKTRITRSSEGFEFLGFNILNPKNHISQVLIPAQKEDAFRQKLQAFISTYPTRRSLDRLLADTIPITQGWKNYYKDCTNTKVVFANIDKLTHNSIYRWLKRKHPTFKKHDFYWKYASSYEEGSWLANEIGQEI